MPGLPVVDSPAVDTVGERLVEIGDGGSTDAYLDELSLVDEDLEVVPASLCEDFCAHSSFEAVAFSGFGLEALCIEFDFCAGLERIPLEEG